MTRKFFRELRIVLSEEGYSIRHAGSLEDAVDQLPSVRPHVVLLDLSRRSTDGVEICRQMRELCNAVILIPLAAKSEKDRIALLDAGADDCISTPLSTAELMARLRARLRRAEISDHNGPVISFGNVQINLAERRVTVGGEDKHFSPKQFEILSYLVTNRNNVIPHAKLLEAVWGPNYASHANYLHMFIRQIRKLIEPDPAHPRYILTEPWFGYRFSLASRSPSVTVLMAENPASYRTEKFALRPAMPTPIRAY